MKQKPNLKEQGHTGERADAGRVTKIGRYAATARSAEAVTVSDARQPAPAFEPPDHSVMN